MIDEILGKIEEDHIMYLFNVIVYDAEWKTVYNKTSIQEGEFTSISGEKQKVELMNSEENMYIDDVDDGKATGLL